MRLGVDMIILKNITVCVYVFMLCFIQISLERGTVSNTHPAFKYKGGVDYLTTLNSMCSDFLLKLFCFSFKHGPS